MLVISGIILLLIGGFGGYQFANLPKVKDMKRNRAVQDRFNIQSNDFTLVLEEPIEQTYILAAEDIEYRIKFSDNTPMKVVFCEALETVG